MFEGRSVRALLVGGLCVLLIAITATGCSDDDGAANRQSSTPRIRATATRLEPGLLRASQLAAIPGTEGLRSDPVAGRSFYENPDPRGPCGAVVDQPKLSEGAIAIFTAHGGAPFMVSSVVDVGERRARAYMDAVIGDTRPGCAPYTSTTNTRETQHVFPTIVELPVTAAQQSGATARIEVGAATSYLGAVVMRTGGRVSFGLLIGAEPISRKTVTTMATQMAIAARRLNRQVSPA